MKESTAEDSRLSEKTELAKTLAMLYDQVPKTIERLKKEDERTVLANSFRKLEAHIVSKLNHLT